jgi:hypothetical protein
VTPPFFNTSFRRDPSQPRDLHARIEAQLIERIEEAVDFVCLDALVRARRTHGLTEPDPASAGDRAEFTASVQVFLARLQRELLGDLGDEQRRRLSGQQVDARDERERLRIQAALARELPTYWQRFDEVRNAYTAERAASDQRV